jgi:hypothetical protein
MKALYGSILLLFVIVGASVALSSQEGFYATAPAKPAAPQMPVTSSALVSATKTFRPASVTGPSSAPLASADLTSPSAPSVVSLSEMGYEAMSLKQRSNLLKEIQMMVRNELLSSRQLEKPDQKMDEYEDEEVMDGACPSAYQGEDYKRRSPQGEAEAESDHYRYSKNSNGSCPPVPDLSDYIRKDSIPCWGCSLK